MGVRLSTDVDTPHGASLLSYGSRFGFCVPNSSVPAQIAAIVGFEK